MKKNNDPILIVYFISVFFSFINTPLYFDPNQITNQAFLSFDKFVLPLQFIPLICIALFFLGWRHRNFIIFIFANILFFLIKSLPEMPNHRYVMLFTTSFLILNGILSKEIFSISNFTKFCRTMIGVIYFFAFFAKLNNDYLNPTISCAGAFYDNISLTSLSFIPTSTLTHYFPIFLSIIFEGLAFIFIFSNRYRPFVIISALIFHLGLSFDLVKYFTNFSSTMYVLLLFSLGPKVLDHVSDIIYSPASKLRYYRYLFGITSAVILILCILSGIDGYVYQEASLKSLVFIRHLLWVSLSLFAINITLTNFKNWKFATPSDKQKLNYLQYALLALFVTNCLGPYLGTKTRSGLTMYSNLRLEPEYSNHLLVPRSANLLGFLSNTAEVMELNKACSTRLKPGLNYPLFELSRVSKQCPEELISIKYEGEVLTENSLIEFLTDYSKTNNFLTRNILPSLILFSPVGPGAENECIW
jgi:hypothetical protein